ncbi:asparagine synthase (glutamine-hydrolyzing) [Terasakiella sp. A23]|uniref:asparagine synthase (glutamine-hydrolyzing) n=1 Tax=Terasakiella sp. FCG-A23 TaxID=3080561 RepID=UPI0029537BEC|nr:asparagine synthase (glutamine-hydrolyzing) [Terasakiella sp. A23]MDV7340826.1 asparagine synthase (glutamine-hydrolyzing) [Terasakiella sp. A23]
MCGIAGLLLPQGITVDPADLTLFSEKQHHRGPDDYGFLGWQQGNHPIEISRNVQQVAEKANVAFVHRRLTIIDETEGGWQPMKSQCGGYALCFNGEIYNYLELKKELKGQGVSFKSQSDTEVLLNALIHWGVEKTLPRLTGMFAFSFLNSNEQTVTLARDPFGIKPMSYVAYQNGIAFASELTTLLALNSFKRTINAQALYNYLRFGFTDMGAKTLFDGVSHLQPAHYAVVDLNNIAINPRRYWAPTIQKTTDISYQEATSHLRDLFMDTVNLHLRSDVPVGAALSGGVDSSAVVMAMRQLKGDDLNLHTFSFIAPGEAMDEESWADIVGQSVGATMHKVQSNGQELINDLDHIIERQGEPFGTTSIYAQYRVFGLARSKNVPVTLDGQGADEILAGYVPFIAARLATMLKRGEILRAKAVLNNALATSGSKSGVILRAMRFLLPGVLQTLGRRMVGEKLVPDWMNASWFEGRNVSLKALQKPIQGDVLRHELKESLVTRVLPSLLRYEDRNSMAHSIESRVPFLTTKIVDFLYSLPEDYLIDDQGRTKAVFRDAMRDIVPDSILGRRDKIGFATPEETWMGQAKPWLEDVLASDRVKELPFLQQSVFQAEIQAVQRGDKALSGEVWRWINLVRWADTFDVDFVS